MKRRVTIKPKRYSGKNHLFPVRQSAYEVRGKPKAQLLENQGE